MSICLRTSAGRGGDAEKKKIMNGGQSWTWRGPSTVSVAFARSEAHGREPGEVAPSPPHRDSSPAARLSPAVGRALFGELVSDVNFPKSLLRPSPGDAHSKPGAGTRRRRLDSRLRSSHRRRGDRSGKTSRMRGGKVERKIQFKAETTGTSRSLMWLRHPLVEGDQTSGNSAQSCASTVLCPPCT